MKAPTLADLFRVPLLGLKGLSGGTNDMVPPSWQHGAGKLLAVYFSAVKIAEN